MNVATNRPIIVQRGDSSNFFGLSKRERQNARDRKAQRKADKSFGSDFNTSGGLGFENKLDAKAQYIKQAKEPSIDALGNEISEDVSGEQMSESTKNILIAGGFAVALIMVIVAIKHKSAKTATN